MLLGCATCLQYPESGQLDSNTKQFLMEVAHREPSFVHAPHACARRNVAALQTMSLQTMLRLPRLPRLPRCGARGTHLGVGVLGAKQGQVPSLGFRVRSRDRWLPACITFQSDGDEAPAAAARRDVHHFPLRLLVC